MTGYESRHFQLEQLADGVYAAMATELGNAASNGGFVDLGDITIAVDSFMSPLAAADLRSVAEEITGRPVTYLFNTHWHGDHVYGNQAYGPETTVIATEKTREMMAERTLDAHASFLKAGPEQFATLEQQIQAAEDEATADRLRAELAKGQELAESLREFELRLPSLTFESNMTIHGSERKAILYTIGGGHTESDAVLHLPDDNIAFCADLLFNQRHPWAGAGNLHEWVWMLLTMEDIHQDDILVPGHGPLGSAISLIMIRQYLSEIERIVYLVIDDGGSVEEAMAAEIPPAFRDWSGEATFQRNLEAIYNRISAPDEE